MLTVHEALARVLEGVQRVPGEEVPLVSALGRVLAGDVAAPMALPPFANSAMDGFAVRAADTPGRLRVVDTIAAGRVGRVAVTGGTASRIMTGAPVPLGADAVVMVEHAEASGEWVTIPQPARPGQHVRALGSDVSRGETVLCAGTTVTPGVAGLLASLGATTAVVAARPRVAILSTGDEIAQPGQPLADGQIYSSNNVALAAMITLAGGHPVDLGNVADEPQATRSAFARAAEVGQLVVSTGGVSVGDFDHVKGALGDGVAFWRVAMKPGKPLAYGRVGGTPTFGLPGNPVSCLVNFLQFVRPVLRVMLGDPLPYLPVVEAHLERPLRRHPGRPEFLRVHLQRRAGAWVATPVGGHQGSGNVRSMADANGLAMVRAETNPVEGAVAVQLMFPGPGDGAAEPAYPWPADHGASHDDAC